MAKSFVSVTSKVLQNAQNGNFTRQIRDQKLSKLIQKLKRGNSYHT